MRSQRGRWATGLVVGLVVGVGVLVGGPLVGLIGIAAVVLLTAEPPRDAPVGGFLSGLGTAWLLLFVRADASCGADCIGPDLTPWYVASLAFMVLGAILSVATLRRVIRRPPPGIGPAGPADVIWFNWPAFIVGSSAAGLLLFLASLALPTMARVTLVAGAIAGSALIVSALIAVVWVFGFGAAKRWAWIRHAAAAPHRWLNVTTGFDDTTETVRRLMSTGSGDAIDVFDTTEPHDAPLRRGRNRFPPTGASRPIDDLSDALTAETYDAVFLIMAAHESHGRDRARLFATLASALAHDGRLILVEHLRDVPNTIAFGPGARHFEARQTWLDVTRAAGLRLVREARLSPYVRGFVFVRAAT